MTNGGLTERQIKVMRLYADGMTTKQVAAELGITEKGVDYHRCSLYRKLRLKSFAQMVKMAVAFGLSTLCLMLYAEPVNLVWNNPNTGVVLEVNIFFTTNISLPTNQWPLLTHIVNSPPGTNSFLTNLPPANYFFTAAYTNAFWQTNIFFSSGAATPPLPTNLVTGFSVLNH